MDKWQVMIDEWVQMITGGTVTAMWIKALIALLLGLIVWMAVKVVLRTAGKRLGRTRLGPIVGELVNIVRKALGYGLLLVIGNYLIQLFKLDMIETLFPAVLIILMAGPAARFLLVILGYLEKNWAGKTETKVDNIIFDLLNKFSGAMIYAVAVITALDLVGINVMPFIAGAGILGLAVGFAAKDTLSNLIAGVLLIIDRPFEVGDRIEVWSAPAGSASWGDVIDIGLRATKIQTTDNIIIVIPNNEIMKRDIVNYTLITSRIRVRINIGVAYDSNIDNVKRVILKVAQEADWICKEPAPKVVVSNFGESSVDLQLRVWIEDARERRNTMSFITDRVKTAFDEAGIEIPYPKRDVYLIQKGAQADSSVPLAKVN